MPTARQIDERERLLEAIETNAMNDAALGPLREQVQGAHLDEFEREQLLGRIVQYRLDNAQARRMALPPEERGDEAAFEGDVDPE